MSNLNRGQMFNLVDPMPKSRSDVSMETDFTYQRGSPEQQKPEFPFNLRKGDVCEVFSKKTKSWQFAEVVGWCDADAGERILVEWIEGNQLLGKAISAGSNHIRPYRDDSYKKPDPYARKGSKEKKAFNRQLQGVRQYAEMKEKVRSQHMSH